jgi:hypothetical protein
MPQIPSHTLAKNVHFENIRSVDHDFANRLYPINIQDNT